MVDEERRSSVGGVQLTAWDMVLTMDLMVATFALGVAVNVALPHKLPTAFALAPMALTVFGFAAWRARRYKVPPPPPTDNLFRRGLGLVMLSVGGLLSLVGAAIAAGATYSLLTSKPADTFPFYALPAFYVPLVLGHALTFAGAKVRAPSSDAS